VEGKWSFFLLVSYIPPAERVGKRRGLKGKMKTLGGRETKKLDGTAYYASQAKCLLGPTHQPRGQPKRKRTVRRTRRRRGGMKISKVIFHLKVSFFFEAKERRGRSILEEGPNGACERGGANRRTWVIVLKKGYTAV